MAHLVEKAPRRQEPPVAVTVSLPRRLHDVFSEKARQKGLRLSMFIEQLIEAAWSQANGIAQAAMPAASTEEKRSLEIGVAGEPAPAPDTVDEDATVLVARYRNWRGETAFRRIVPIGITYGSTQWHPDDQLFLLALDKERREVREFAFSGFLPITHHDDANDPQPDALTVDCQVEPAGGSIQPAPPEGVCLTGPGPERIIRGLLAAGMSPREIAKDYPYSVEQVRLVKRGGRS